MKIKIVTEIDGDEEKLRNKFEEIGQVLVQQFVEITGVELIDDRVEVKIDDIDIIDAIILALNGVITPKGLI